MTSIGRCLAIVTVWTSAAQAEPRNAAVTALHEAGKRAFASGRYADALDAYQAAFKLEPNPAFLYNVALAQLGLGRCAEAFESYGAFLKAAPNLPSRPQLEASWAARQQCRSFRPEAHPTEPALASPASSATTLSPSAPSPQTTSPPTTASPTAASSTTAASPTSTASQTTASTVTPSPTPSLSPIESRVQTNEEPALAPARTVTTPDRSAPVWLSVGLVTGLATLATGVTFAIVAGTEHRRLQMTCAPQCDPRTWYTLRTLDVASMPLIAIGAVLAALSGVGLLVW